MDWLSTDDAVALLGVKRSTLYAYASRGKIRTQQHGRRKRYLRSDLDRLRARKRARAGHGAVAADALRWGQPVLDSAITQIHPEGHRYRGRSALELADIWSFEQTAEHLWSLEPPSSSWPRVAWPFGPARLCSLNGPEPRIIDVIASAIPVLAMHDSQRLHRGRDATLEVARRLIRYIAAAPALMRGAAAARSALAQPTIARTVLDAFGVPYRRTAERALTETLILCADHGLNPSSFAGRVAASADADLYACVGAALATLSGPRHGGMPARVAFLFEEIGSPAYTARTVSERLRRGDEIPGFGHTLYPDGDPRAMPLLTAACRLAPRRKAVAIAESLVETMKLAGGQPPTLDVGLAAMAAALCLPRGAATALFAIGRSAGWVAQILEQKNAGYVLRPRARYIGPAPRNSLR